MKEKKLKDHRTETQGREAKRGKEVARDGPEINGEKDVVGEM